jgi:hypothetical protein
MSQHAVTARRNSVEASAKRLQRWSISACNVDDIRAALDRAEQTGTLRVHDILDAMDVLMLDLAVMCMPVGLDPASVPELMIPLPGWRKR